jgi:hypothetical protein
VGDCLFTTGWFAGFKKRHDFVLRRVTSYSHKPSTAIENDNPTIRLFRDSIAKLDPRRVLVNMDETPVWFDNQSRYTVTTKGTRHVKQRATSNEKKRITVVLGCKSNGEKLPPVVILKSKYSGPVPEGMLIWYQEKAWMNSTLSLQWLDQFATNDTHLLWDCFSGHKSEKVKERLKTIDHSFIPPRTTALLQPLDVGVNKPFKDRLRTKWNHWIEGGKLTKYGNYASVPISLLLEWIADCWDSITTSTILNAFGAAFGAAF